MLTFISVPSTLRTIFFCFFIATERAADENESSSDDDEDEEYEAGMLKITNI